MPGLTTRLKLPWTKLEEGADIEVATKPLAEALDNAVLTTVGAGAPPAQPVPAGNMHFRADTRVLYVSDGAAWWPLMTGGSAPIGQLAAFGMNNVIDADGQVRWLLCNGSPQSSATYPTLFQAIGTLYGTGDGAGNDFNLPDAKGRVLAGVDSGAGRLTANNTLGKSGGKEDHALTVFQMPNHHHNGATQNANTPDHTHNDPGQPFATHRPGDVINWPGVGPQPFVQGSATATGGVTNGAGALAHNHIITPEGGNGPHPNTQPYLVVNWFIKAKS